MSETTTKFFRVKAQAVKTVEALVPAKNESEAQVLLKKMLNANDRSISHSAHVLTNIESQFDHEVAYGIGQRVKHPVFGAGTITDMDSSGDMVSINFDSDEFTQKRLATKFAKLTAVDEPVS